MFKNVLKVPKIFKHKFLSQEYVYIKVVAIKHLHFMCSTIFFSFSVIKFLIQS